MNGVININKSLGMTSFDVVAKVKKIAKEKKVGHTGTLDPEASGVLPVCLGKATKIIDYIMENKKIYRVSFKLGMTTDTYDLEGKIISETDISNITENQVIETILKFIGNINQIPPMYSALKKNGVRLYELARQGIEVEREARPITIYSIENIVVDLPNVSMDVACS
ncbi:MAG: tRNA pseudouridine(55) synthase TruB, partial [Sarcina sp.]